jgi:hypothetical protein
VIWSKLKRAIENLLADSLKDRVQFHITRYGPGHSGTMSRAWITWDKTELVNFSTIEWMQEYYGLAHQIQEINHCQDFHADDQREGYYNALGQAGAIVDKKGVYSRFDFYEAMEDYLQLPIEDAMRSENIIIKALSMFDRRMGKRHLRQIHLSSTEHPLVKKFYQLRCEAEGIAAALE